MSDSHTTPEHYPTLKRQTSMSFLNRVFSASAVTTIKPPEANAEEPRPTTARNWVSDLAARTQSFDMTSSASFVLPWTPGTRPTATRHSRASSIVSTQTRYSTTTLQDDARSIDARSIDIHVGGQTFRIARDGSRITDAPPPPYSGPLHSLPDGRPRASSQSRAWPSSSTNRLQEGAAFRAGRPGGSSTFDHYYGESDEEMYETGAETPRQRSRAPSPTARPRANILNPADLDMPSPVESGSERLLVPADGGDTPSRNWSYKAGPDTITVAPNAPKFRSVSQNDLPLLDDRYSPPLRRRNGVRLPALITERLDDRSGSQDRFGKLRSPKQIHSAGAVLYSMHAEEPLSPTFIGRDAQGIFPRNQKQKKASLSTPLEDETDELPSSSTVFLHGSDGEEKQQPPPMDTENDISLHYARLMRRLDRDHRRALHLKDKDLEKLRERLNEMDIVYRQQLKSRDFVIDDLKKRLDSVQDKTENMIEQARNEVEDLWENRWKNQSSKLTERIKRIEEDAQTTIDRLKAERGAGQIEDYA